MYNIYPRLYDLSSISIEQYCGEKKLTDWLIWNQWQDETADARNLKFFKRVSLGTKACDKAEFLKICIQGFQNCTKN